MVDSTTQQPWSYGRIFYYYYYSRLLWLQLLLLQILLWLIMMSLLWLLLLGYESVGPLMLPRKRPHDPASNTRTVAVLVVRVASWLLYYYW